jgi:hypothetical protein
MIADTPGLFSYRVKAVGDWSVPERDACSIIVQKVAKVTLCLFYEEGKQQKTCQGEG